MSRQNGYKGVQARQRRAVDEQAVVNLVRRERALQPRLGVRKLHVLLRRELEAMGIRIGRDRLFALLRERGMLIHRRVRGPRTTDARHGFRTYPNLFQDLEVSAPDQAWLSDITYVRTDEGFMYLSLISDAYSRKIVGYELREHLDAQGPLVALEMALRQLATDARPVHHSDRGVQYCCRAYIALLETRQLVVSMTEVDHCYENAQAERLNGILKGEYGLGDTFRTKAQAQAAVTEAIRLYNTRRPHTSLGYRTPESVHRPAA
jgi:transposase InsO family protein